MNIKEIYDNAKKALLLEIKYMLKESKGVIKFKNPISNGMNYSHNERWEGMISKIMFAKHSDNISPFEDENYPQTEILYTECGCYDQKLSELGIDKIYEIAEACKENMQN